MIDCKNGKVKHTADIKGNQDDGKKIKQEGNTVGGGVT